MNDIDRKAQETLEHNIAIKDSCAAHNYRAALAESQNRERKWKIAFWLVCFAALVAVCVGRGR